MIRTEIYLETFEETNTQVAGEFLLSAPKLNASRLFGFVIQKPEKDRPETMVITITKNGKVCIEQHGEAPTREFLAKCSWEEKIPLVALNAILLAYRGKLNELGGVKAASIATPIQDELLDDLLKALS